MSSNSQRKISDQLILGIDYGETNIGLAFGRNNLVMPLTTISGKNDFAAISEIVRYTMENKITKILVGLPLNAEGRETHQSHTVRRFVNLMKIRVKIPIEYINEFHTSIDSKTEAINLGINKKRRQEVDSLSAALVVKEYYSRKID